MFVITLQLPAVEPGHLPIVRGLDRGGMGGWVTRGWVLLNEGWNVCELMERNHAERMLLMMIMILSSFLLMRVMMMILVMHR